MIKRFAILLIGFCLALKVSASDEAGPKRIVALAPHAVELLFLLGVGDRIVATTEYADFPEAATKIPRIGGYNGIQLDRLVELDPDLVVIWKSGNPEQDVTRIEQLGFNIYYSETTSLERFPDEIERLGQVTGQAEVAKQKADEFRAEMSALQTRYEQSEKVRFFYQLWSDPLRTIGVGSWINTIFSVCGGENVFDDPALDYPQVSMESVIERAPDAIVVPTHHGGEISVEQWSAWPEIPAVKNSNILFFDGDLLHRYSFRILEGMREVCERFEQVRPGLGDPVSNNG